MQMLSRAGDSIHWELESPEFICLGIKSKYLLRYDQKLEKWCVYPVFLEGLEPMYREDWWDCSENYAESLDYFNQCCDFEGVDKSKIKYIRIVHPLK